MTPQPSATSPPKPAMLKQVTNTLTVAVVPPVGYHIIRLLGRTMTLRIEGAEQLTQRFAQGKRVILAFWHAQQLMIPLGYRGQGSHVLISQHGDGEIIARIIARFGHEAVRGSSTRGGAGALRALIKLGRAGKDLVVTPDGPKGPRQIAKLGVIQLAKATGLPIVPLAFACSKKNSSRVGIASWSPIRAHGACSSMASRYGCRARTTTPRLKPAAWNWKRSSIG